MNNILIYSIVTLSGMGAIAATVLFWASKKFQIDEDPDIDLINEILPGANCGGCGLAGCRNFAEAVVKSRDLDSKVCPVGGADCTKKMAQILGLEAIAREKKVAVLRCQGTKAYATQKNIYQGAKTCIHSHLLFAGESGCSYGCMGFGDCQRSCLFEAITIDEKESGLPEVAFEKCTGCGACVRTCPRNIFELRPLTKDHIQLYVACMNKEKGAAAKKNCKVTCIGCNKCVKTVQGKAEGISVNKFLSYIAPTVDPILYGKALVDSCPTKAIIVKNLKVGDIGDEG